MQTAPPNMPAPIIDPSDRGESSDEAIFGLDIGRYLTALRRYAWIVIALVAIAVTVSVFYTKRQTEIFSATASVLIEPRTSDLLGQGTEILAAGVAGSSPDYFKQQKQILASYQLARRTAERLQLHLEFIPELRRTGRSLEEMLDAAARKLQTMITVRYPEANRTMYVVVRSPSPKLAADIANGHVATYVEYSKGLLSTGSDMASAALSTEVEDAERARQAAIDAVYQFQQANDLMTGSMAERQTRVMTNINTYTARLNEARAERIAIGAKLDRLKRVQNVDAIDSPILAMADSAVFDSLRAAYYEQSLKLKETAITYGEKTEEYQRAKATRDDAYGALQIEAKRTVGAVEEQYQAAFATERALGAEVDKFAKEAREDVAPKAKRFTELTDLAKKAEDNYNMLIARLTTSQTVGRVTSRVDSNVRPLDPARVSKKPVSPNLQTNVAIAASLGVVLGIGVIMLIVFLDRSVKSADDAQVSAQAPVLGIIPVLENADGDNKARDLYVHTHPTSRVAECCRSLRTNIVFSGADRSLKTLVVSSANPREGKTTSVIYLGTTMAQSGQRVLLIDTDMRRPRLHESTGVPRGKGLSNLIVGEDSFDEAIKSTEIPNLFVLPCGPLPPNPAELLMTQRFSAVLEELGRRFDRIILDSPPLGAVTDAVVLSRQTDGVLLVVRAGKTLRDEVKRSARQIRGVGGQIVGVVLNEFDMSDKRTYRYGYYGYGEAETAAAAAAARAT